jgi:HEAT repeat protein
MRKALLLSCLLALPCAAETILIVECVDTPAGKWDKPACAEFERNSKWIKRLADGDESVIPLLREAYDATFTYEERRRIATELQGHLPNDAELWRESYTLAEHAVSGDFTPGGEEHRDDYARFATNALFLIAEDPRTHALMIKALASEDSDVVCAAIFGLASQKDAAQLAAIEKAIRRFPEKQAQLAFSLFAFRTTAADEIALRYIEDVDDYLTARSR